MITILIAIAETIINFKKNINPQHLFYLRIDAFFIMRKVLLLFFIIHFISCSNKRNTDYYKNLNPITKTDISINSIILDLSLIHI